MTDKEYRTELGALKAALEWSKQPTQDGVERWAVEGYAIVKGRRRSTTRGVRSGKVKRQTTVMFHVYRQSQLVFGCGDLTSAFRYIADQVESLDSSLAGMPAEVE